MKLVSQLLAGPIARGTIRATFVLGLRLIVQAGTLLIVARMLGPDEFGAFAGIASLAVILGTLSTFGTHLILLAEGAKDPARQAPVLAFAVPTTLLCGAALFLIYLGVALSVLGHLHVALHVLVAIGLTETLLQPLFGLAATEHLAIGRIARSQLLQILPLAMRLATAIAVLLLALPNPLAAYAWGYLAASVIALIATTPWMPAPWPRIATWRFARRSELREAVGYAALNITKAGPAELDKTLAARLLPLGAAGVYSAAARVIGAITLPVTAMTLSSLPRLFREGQEQRARTGHLLRMMFGAAAGYSVVLAGILWIVAPIFDWIFGAKYQGVAHTIRWLCIAIPGMCLRLTAGNVLMALGKSWMRVGYETSGLAILVIATILLTAHLGAIGMPLSLACAESSMAAIACWLTHLVHRRDRP